MYKCYHCGSIFYETSTKDEEPDYVPSPFGVVPVRMGGGTFDCCPECESYHYEKMYFDGVHCPYCSEIISLEGIIDVDNCEFTCDKCQAEFVIENGEIEDVYRK